VASKRGGGMVLNESPAASDRWRDGAGGGVKVVRVVGVVWRCGVG